MGSTHSTRVEGTAGELGTYATGGIAHRARGKHYEDPQANSLRFLFVLPPHLLSRLRRRVGWRKFKERRRSSGPRAEQDVAGAGGGRGKLGQAERKGGGTGILEYVLWSLHRRHSASE